MSYVWTLNESQMEETANIGKDLTLAHLRSEGIITDEQFDDLAPNLFMTCRKQNWFTSLLKFGKGKKESWRIAKLCRCSGITVPEDEQGET